MLSSKSFVLVVDSNELDELDVSMSDGIETAVLLSLFLSSTVVLVSLLQSVSVSMLVVLLFLL